MIILQILQKKEVKRGALPTFDPFGDYEIISQQFFLNEDEEKAKKLRDEINERFNKDEENIYKAKIYSIW